MSVKSRILQFQQNSPPQSSSSLHSQTSLGNGGGSSNPNANIISANIDTLNNHSVINNPNNTNGINKSTSLFTLPALPNRPNCTSINNTTKSTTSNTNTTNGGNFQPQHQYHHNYNIIGETRKTEGTNFNNIHSKKNNNNNSNNFLVNDTKTEQLRSICTANKSLGSDNNSGIMSNQNPPVNRATKPTLSSKKASMTINLSGNVNNQNNNPSLVSRAQSDLSSTKLSPTRGGTSPQQQQRTRFNRSPTKTLSSPSSAIPKPFGSTPSGHQGYSGLNGSLVNNSNSSSNSSTVAGRRSPGKSNTPVTTPTRSDSHINGFSSSNNGISPTSTGRLYGAIGWKEKYEESEKKRNHLVNLAQKATRDYEELRRRYHDIHSENEKLSRRLDGATGQLDSLQKASEAVYDEYYKLKKRYEAENREKSDALTRVDQYNKENRRLKRQSAALMMQVTDPTSLASAFDAVCETDSAENDKEILYLRNRNHELEAKVVDLESELEKTKLAEFETQESVMLVNDSVNSIKVENIKLKEQLKQLDEENRKALSSLEDVTFEFESLKANFLVNEEKLIVAETELKKLLNEKNILQRQSLVFMNDAMDNRLLDALNQIGDLQTALEEQKNSFEAQIADLQHHVVNAESTEESTHIQTSARIKSLEEEVKSLRKRAEDAEQKLEELPSLNECSGPPPPPPPPMPMSCPPLPPPPMPMGGVSLNNSLRSAMGTLRRAGTNLNGDGSCSESGTPPNGVSDGSPKSIVTQSPQIDDVISQLKKGIKLKPMDRTISRKPTEVPEEKTQDTAVEEMRSILNNLRRTRR